MQPGYGAPPGGVNPEVQQWFNAVDRDRSGAINAKELQAALVNGQGKNFSDSACALMIGMFDHDKSGTIDVNEFQQLYAYINQWLTVFRTYDRDQSGNIEEAELAQGKYLHFTKILTSNQLISIHPALQQMGFRFSPDFITLLIKKSDLQSHRVMTVDQFIVVCVQIQKFTEEFRKRDTNMAGTITIGFEDFLGLALNCST